MLSRNEFDNYDPGVDQYANRKAKLVVGDLEPAFTGEPKVSIMISTWNRQWQLARSLECLARQEWKEFEVLIMDDGSTQDFSPIFDLFSNFLQLRTFRAERNSWRSCPSRAYKSMLPEVKGEVVVITHPEMMLHFDAVQSLYQGCTSSEKLEDAYYYSLRKSSELAGDWTWMSLKPQFLDQSYYMMLDIADWHTKVENVWKLPGFMNIIGFSGKPNSEHVTWKAYPWWFVGAAKRECPIWDDMPTIDGHGIIDMWLMSYRSTYNFVEIAPNKPTCLHQPHQVSAIAPKGEQKSDALKIQQKLSNQKILSNIKNVVYNTR